ncbi:MAG: DUF1797 family protein, partial [Lactococcus sp.]|nr:DUF1797 family protein [Lactococcus sp.]MDN6539526.1 DUF1797 family protein [Lactococcus sp.]
FKIKDSVKMKSHLSAIINRLEKLIDSGDPKDTFNFEKNEEVQITVSFDGDNQVFIVKYPKIKETSDFDSIDLVAMEVFDLIY